MYEFLPTNLWKLIPPAPTITYISPLGSLYFEGILLVVIGFGLLAELYSNGTDLDNHVNVLQELNLLHMYRKVDDKYLANHLYLDKS